MKGRIPGFSYNPKKHLAHFSLYAPKTNGKVRRERTVHAESREEAIRLWQAFHAEVNGNPPAIEPPQLRTITFAAFVTEYLEKICARRAAKTLAIYRTIAFTRLIPYSGKGRSTPFAHATWRTSWPRCWVSAVLRTSTTALER